MLAHSPIHLVTDTASFDSYEFDENEVVLCMEEMVLEATSTEAGVKKYLVVGTSVNRGEDMSSKGNVSTARQPKILVSHFPRPTSSRSWKSSVSMAVSGTGAFD